MFGQLKVFLLTDPLPHFAWTFLPSMINLRKYRYHGKQLLKPDQISFFTWTSLKKSETLCLWILNFFMNKISNNLLIHIFFISCRRKGVCSLEATVNCSNLGLPDITWDGKTAIFYRTSRVIFLYCLKNIEMYLFSKKILQ